MAFSGAWNDTFLAVSGPWNQEKPFWSFQRPEMTICWRFQGPEKTPYWLFQAPEIRKSLFGVFRGLKWPYVGVFRGLKRHLIGWKRWYYGSILKWLTNTEKTVPTQSGSVQVLPQHIFLWGGGSGTGFLYPPPPWLIWCKTIFNKAGWAAELSGPEKRGTGSPIETKDMVQQPNHQAQRNGVLGAQ